MTIQVDVMTRRRISTFAVVLAALTLVYCLPVPACAQASPANAAATPSAGNLVKKAVTLPPNVAAMRDLILTAVQSGKLEDLEPAIEQNELPPEVGAAAGTGVLDHLRQSSANKSGQDMLAVLGNLLATEPALLPIGRDHENNGVYVWPGIAEADLSALTPSQKVELLRLMPAAEADALVASKKWDWWRLAIGADGTWLAFMKHGPAKP